MVINGKKLLEAAPIKGMIGTKEKFSGTSYGLGEAGYDICIKQEVYFEPGLNQVSVFLHNYTVSREIGRFALASAIEEFQMPTNMLGIVHDKSTWARRGLSVFNTVIEPGWHGFLTLELVYHGNENLLIPAGSGIAQVVFHELAENAKYVGKYANQPDRPVHARID